DLVAGEFFRPLAMAYILAVLASLLVALTVTPALALLLLPRAVEQRSLPPLARGARRVYRGLLPFALKRPALPLALLLLLGVGAGLLLPTLKPEYLPRFKENDFLMHWVSKPGTGLDVMRDDIKTVSRELRTNTPVEQFGSHIARAAEHGEEVVGTNFAELWISLGDYQGDYDAARHQIEEVMSHHAGFEYDLLTYLQERIKEVLSGSSGAIVLRIYGPDLGVLRDKANAVKAAIEGSEGRGAVAGVIELKVEPQVLVPQLDLQFLPDKLATYGLTRGVVADDVATLLGGTKVNEVHTDQKTFDVVVWADPALRRQEYDLGTLELDLPNGKGTVPLRNVARLRH